MNRLDKLTSRVGPSRTARAFSLAMVTFLLCSSGNVALGNSPTIANADDGGNGPSQLRRFIGRQVGGIDKLMVPDNAHLPIPRLPDGTLTTNPRYQTTEAKRYLGKLLFHDPVRTARVNKGNAGQTDPQPLRDFPAGTAFGGTLNAADPGTQAIEDATRQTGSCGSCHIGEAAGKAGQQLNFNTGGEGRGYTDEKGNFFPRRRPQAILAKMRSAPIFPGDVLVDSLPTLTDIVGVGGQRQVTTPARFFHEPPPSDQFASGRLDQIDSVARVSPGMVGFAFNNRLLLGGFAGEVQSVQGSANPFNDPAAENLTLLLLDAHRMINFQSAKLRNIPAFVKLFQDAFPEEAAKAIADGDPKLVINDETEFRAQATFLRTVVTRNTPFDRFLAGSNSALTAAQRRGAKMYFTSATEGGAGCSSCHSGPMLNKQPNDPDVVGTGQFVEENFINVGIGDHPVQALNAAARGRLDPNRLGLDGLPYHAEDTGRQEITFNPNDAFKFRVLTLRQLKDGRNFMHSGAFTKVRDVVEYFNAGVPQDPTAGAATTLSARFTNPRGSGYPRGLGLSKRQVDDLTDFLENGLDDPALVTYDPKSTTVTLQPNIRDLTYSKYRPDLAALGARDGFMLSGLAIDENDPLARRDQGLEFLDVTGQVSTMLTRSDHRDDDPVSQGGDAVGPDGAAVSQSGNASDQSSSSDKERGGKRQMDELRIMNTSATAVDTHLLIVVQGLPAGVQLTNASGTTSAGEPYIRVFLNDGLLLSGQSIKQELSFKRLRNGPPVSYTLKFLSGQGKP